MPYSDINNARAAGRKSYHKRMKNPKLRQRLRDLQRESRAVRENYQSKHRQDVARRRNEDLEWARLTVNLSRYRLTLDQYHSLMESQDFGCAICGGDISATDHNHVTGRVRGLLCCNCNVGLGQFKDSPQLLEKAAIYVTRQGLTPRGESL